jgi:hypothetical protein
MRAGDIRAIPRRRNLLAEGAFGDYRQAEAQRLLSLLRAH